MNGISLCQNKIVYVSKRLKRLFQYCKSLNKSEFPYILKSEKKFDIRQCMNTVYFEIQCNGKSRNIHVFYMENETLEYTSWGMTQYGNIILLVWVVTQENCLRNLRSLHTATKTS